jgi:hypothetical protein
MLTHKVGKRMLRNALQAVQWISDKEYQKRVWIGGEGPNDFDETACHFFDNGDPVLKDYKLCEITESQHDILNKFRDKFRNFSDEHSYEPTFIDTPEWSEIMDMAKEVLKAFNYKKTSA